MEKDFNELELLKERIVELESELHEARTHYKELRTSKLREAVDARREADKAIAEELKNLGYNSNPLWMRKYF